MYTAQTQTDNLSIELLRGIAAIMVMLCHYSPYIYDLERSWMNFLYTGVDFFFVISGFVFAPTLLGPERENATAFIIRRIFRIYPLFLFAIILYALSPGKIWNTSIFFQHIFFLHTTSSKEIAFYYNPAFWSLPVEIEFYLLTATLVFLKIRHTKFVLIALFGLSLLISLLAHNVITNDSYIKLLLLHHLPSILPEFLLGTLAYIVSRNLDWVSEALFGIAGLLLLLILAKGFVAHGDNINDMTYGMFSLLCVLGYQWIIIATVTLSNRIQGVAKFGFLAGLLGYLSYGIYLFHNAMPTVLKYFFGMENFILLIASMSLTIFVAGVMYLILENPARKFGKHYSARYYTSN